jgi:hypothetical protein
MTMTRGKKSFTRKIETCSKPDLALMFLGNLVLQLLDEVMVGVDAKRAGSRNSSPKNVTLKLYINRVHNWPRKNMEPMLYNTFGVNW